MALWHLTSLFILLLDFWIPAYQLGYPKDGFGLLLKNERENRVEVGTKVEEKKGLGTDTNSNNVFFFSF